MTLEEIKELLLEVTPNSYHYEAWEQKDTYIVWAEDSENGSIHADNQKKILIVDVTIDVFTKEEFPEITEQLKDKLNEKKIPFMLLSIQYEEDTEYTHYEYLIQGVM